MTLLRTPALAAERPSALNHSADVPLAVESAATALFGEAWRQPLARLLGLHFRAVQQIAAAAMDGKPYPVAPGVLSDLIRELDAWGLGRTESRAQLVAALEWLKSHP